MRPAKALWFALVLLGGCALREKPEAAYYHMEQGKLPPSDVTLNIPGLGPCTDNPDRRLQLNSSQPVNVLTHGCFGSSGQFRGLAQVLAFQGQQTACFTYDDRDGLAKSATALRNAVHQLAEQTRIPQITVIGHSQGALVARKSLTEFPVGPSQRQTSLRLVTISGPFNGIGSAEACGKQWLSWLTVGLLPVSCYIVTGAKWMDITSASDFIRKPGALAPEVDDYLKIDTDERNTCRREQNGRCLESDDVFSLDEQRNAVVESFPRSRRVEVRAGHVEIVGDKRKAPLKLITTLQEQGVLSRTAPDRIAAFRQMLVRVYQDDSLSSVPDAGAR